MFHALRYYPDNSLRFPENYRANRTEQLPLSHARGLHNTQTMILGKRLKY